MSGAPFVAAPRVHHLAVLVRDLDRAEAFYGVVLGLQPVRRWLDTEGAPRSIWFELGAGAFLAVERAPAAASIASEPPAPGWHVVALAIELAAREAWRARLADAGHPVERETDHTLYTRDPEGNLIALSHWPEPRAG